MRFTTEAQKESKFVGYWVPEIHFSFPEGAMWFRKGSLAVNYIGERPVGSQSAPSRLANLWMARSWRRMTFSSP